MIEPGDEIYVDIYCKDQIYYYLNKSAHVVWLEVFKFYHFEAHLEGNNEALFND